MNLIEQLGGYDKAKAFLNAASYTIDELIMMQRSGLRPQHVEKALLEYRRQHNIFEVGDWVYPLIRIIDEIEGVGRYVCTEKGEIVVVRDVRNKGAFCSHEHRLDNSFYMAFSEFRHATDEEIEAGKRLEVV